MAPPAEQPESSTPEKENFHERSTLENGMSAAAVSAFAGLLVSSVQNSLQKHNAGALGVFTRTGSTIALFTAMGGIFSLVDSFAANTRRENDALNGAIGGCAAGLVAGASARSVPMMAGSCAGLAALIGTFDAAGKSISGSYARGMPIYGAKATEGGGMAIEGQHLSNVPVRGEVGWREERERRRQQFFKPRKTTETESSE